MHVLGERVAELENGDGRTDGLDLVPNTRMAHDESDANATRNDDGRMMHGVTWHT